METKLEQRPIDRLPDGQPGLETVAAPAAETEPEVVRAVRDGVLDAGLAGLVSVLVAAGAPLVIAGPGASPSDRAFRTRLLAEMLAVLPPARTRLALLGDAEDFTWLAAAEMLGWRRTRPVAVDPATPETTVLLAGELGSGPPADTTGDRARLVIRALSVGFGLGATIEGGRLEDVLDRLRARPTRLTDDELTRLGIVLVLGGPRPTAAPGIRPGFRPDGRPRVVAAHYVRPLARDVHGHLQRLPPAVLATWDDQAQRYEQFAWGVASELALRVGRRTGDFERDCEHRAALISRAAEQTP